MKNFQQLSRVSSWPEPFTSLRTPAMMFSTSSSGNRSGISPEASMSLMSTRKCSLATWASVIRNMMPTFLSPDFMYSADNSVWPTQRSQWSRWRRPNVALEGERAGVP